MQQLKAIIFDVDGTLANTEETHRLAFNAAFQEFGLNYHWSEQDYIELLSISGGRERITAFLKSQNDFDFTTEIKLREFARQIHERKSEIYREKLVAGHIGLRSGVKRLIAEARQKQIKIGIATATSYANVKTLLENNLGSGALDNFAVIVTSDIVKDKKPYPVVYQFAIAELGLVPEDCIAIEDTANGNLAAYNSGLQVVITTHNFTTDNDFSGASLVVDQLGEPDQPFNITSGNAYDSSYVDIALLNKILESSHQGIARNRIDDAVVMAK